MTLFRNTAKAAEFIGTANSRNTSPEIMRAIAYYATDAAEAVALWASPGWSWNEGVGIDCIARHATDNGRLHAANLHWGDRTLEQIMSDGEA